MASLSEGSAFEMMDARKTDERLSETLVIRFLHEDGDDVPRERILGILPRLGARTSDLPEPDEAGRITLQIADLPALEGHHSREKILAREIEELLALSLRAYPVQQPIITDYIDILAEAARGKRVKDLEERLLELAERRAAILAVVKNAEHFLDFHEATETSHLSTQFDDYLRLRETFERPRPPRPDPISRYLDSLESEWR